jgi:hypothetical protein
MPANSSSGALREPTCAPLVGFVRCSMHSKGEISMHGIIYLVGLVVVILAVLSLFGLR